jgi:hypothetical protein
VLDFAVAQILRDDAALGALPAATATALIGRGRPLSDDLRRGNLRA